MDKNNKGWNFIHNIAQNADWKPGLREIFDYRDLGLKDGTNGDYIAHIIKANGKELKDEVKEWHLHECEFQFVLVLIVVEHPLNLQPLLIFLVCHMTDLFLL